MVGAPDSVDGPGPQRFDAFMEAALYDPDRGFYGAGAGGAGRRGDFLTAPEVGPLFGAVLARWLDACWDRCGRPDPFNAIDAGAGPGTLVRSILAASPACAAALRWTLADRSPAARTRHEGLGRSVERIDGAAGSGAAAATTAAAIGPAHVIVANELLDNLAVRLLQRHAGVWSEIWVDNGRPRLRPADPLPAPAASVLGALDASAMPDGARLPVLEAAAAWVAGARRLLVPEGRLLVFDYGVIRTGDLLARPAEDWLRTYRRHSRGGDPFDEPGSQDITCEVPFDQLPSSFEVVAQADWLRRWGIEALVEAGRELWRARAGVGDLAALRARSRIAESEALLDPDGLGAFLVAEWGRRAAPGRPPRPPSEPVRRRRWARHRPFQRNAVPAGCAAYARHDAHVRGPPTAQQGQSAGDGAAADR
ncbi:MAG: SAM-dependent methyltransferase [Acidimicrobiales bacterium]